MEKCPKFEDAPETVRAEYDLDGIEYAPSCPGNITRGSGGHRMHDGSCRELATWWHPDDMHAYCDAHCPERDKPIFLQLWEKTLAPAF